MVASTVKNVLLSIVFCIVSILFWSVLKKQIDFSRININQVLLFFFIFEGLLFYYVFFYVWKQTKYKAFAWLFIALIISIYDYYYVEKYFGAGFSFLMVYGVQTIKYGVIYLLCFSINRLVK